MIKKKGGPGGAKAVEYQGPNFGNAEFSPSKTGSKQAAADPQEVTNLKSEMQRL